MYKVVRSLGHQAAYRSSRDCLAKGDVITNQVSKTAPIMKAIEERNYC